MSVAALLHKLSKTEGQVSVSQGILTFPDGMTADLRLPMHTGFTRCHHCGGLMNQAQQYLCGCTECRKEPYVVGDLETQD